MTPISQLFDALAEQVPPESISLERCRPFPPPLGAWLTRGEPRNLRASMRRTGTTPASLLHAWLIRYPFRLQVETWTRKRVKTMAQKWPKRIQRIYARDRQAMVKLFEVRGKVSDATGLTCTRFGAWRAMSALEVEMPASELQWAGLAMRVQGSGWDDYIAYSGDDVKGIVEASGTAGESWWLLSDNCKADLKGQVAFRVSEIGQLMEAGKEAQRIAWTAKEVLAARGSRVVVESKQQEPEEAEGEAA